MNFIEEQPLASKNLTTAHISEQVSMVIAMFFDQCVNEVSDTF